MAGYIGDKAEASAAKLVRLPQPLSIVPGSRGHSRKAAGSASAPAAGGCSPSPPPNAAALTAHSTVPPHRPTLIAAGV